MPLPKLLAGLNIIWRGRASSRLYQLHEQKNVNLFDTKFLFASLLWGSIGVGYWIYGKKQQAMIPMIGGAVMIGVSYLVSSWLLMSLICIVLMVAVYQLMKRGY